MFSYLKIRTGCVYSYKNCAVIFEYFVDVDVMTAPVHRLVSGSYLRRRFKSTRQEAALRNRHRIVLTECLVLHRHRTMSTPTQSHLSCPVLTDTTSVFWRTDKLVQERPLRCRVLRMTPALMSGLSYKCFNYVVKLNEYFTIS